MSANGLLGVGVTGLLAFQRALGTVSHNIANAQTESYSRQKVDLTTRIPSFNGYGYIGSGVQVRSIARVYDQFITEELQTSTSSHSQLQRFHQLAAQVDDILADPKAGLSPALQGFFNAAQDLANDPASTASRNVLLSEAGTLVDRFHYLNARFEDQYENVNAQISTTITEIDSLASSIAEINRTIVNAASNGGTQMPNDLLDQRDKLLTDLSERVAITTVPQNDGSLNVYIGNGQVLVSGFEKQNLSSVKNIYDPTRYEINVSAGPSSSINITEQLSGGTLGGVLAFRDQILDPTLNSMGRIAIGLASGFNEQHQLGMDLNNEMGGDFFSIPSMNVVASSRNDVTTGISISLSDSNQLTTSDYRLVYDGGNRYTLTRLSDNSKSYIDVSAGYPYTSNAIDGFTINITAPPSTNDTFLIQPTADAARTFELEISDIAKIAAASPLQSSQIQSNTGTGVVSPATVTDINAYDGDTYQVLLADLTSASAGGSIGGITDNNSDSTLQYELSINGQLVYTQTESDTPLADLNALATAINGASDVNVATTGVKAYLNAGATSLYLTRVPASALPITIQENLSTTAGPIEDNDTVIGYFGSALTGVTTPTNSIAYNPTADSYIVLDSTGNVESTAAYSAGEDITVNGVQTSISGVPNFGDSFILGANTNGVSDNRNALKLAELQKNLVLAGGTSTYQDAYAKIVGDVGTATHRADLNRNAQEALLNHAKEARAQVSGVNLDEEAADLLKFQQAYQAAAHIITTADTLFQSLLTAMRR